MYFPYKTQNTRIRSEIIFQYINRTTGSIFMLLQHIGQNVWKN